MTPAEHDFRRDSPEFSLEYEQMQQFRRLREARKPVTTRKHKAKQRQLDLTVIRRIEIIQMADLPRYHYEVWADYEGGDSCLLSRDYIHGLKNAVSLAVEKWGPQRIELCRWHPKRHLPNVVLATGEAV